MKTTFFIIKKYIFITQTTSYSDETLYLKEIDLSYTDFILKTKPIIIKKILFIAIKFVSTSYLRETFSFKEIDFPIKTGYGNQSLYYKEVHIYYADFLFKPSLLLI